MFYKPEIIHKPKITSILFGEKKKKCFEVDILNEEYDICEKSSGKYWANSKQGGYGKGLGRTKNDEFKPVRTGLLGQIAFSKLFGESLDLNYRKGGDDCDNLIGGVHKVDVKCAMRNYGKGLIYYRNEWGKQIPLNKDIYVFGFVGDEDRSKQKATIVLVGFLTRKNIIEMCDVEVGIKGNGHLNYVVPFSKTRSIILLRDRKIETYGL